MNIPGLNWILLMPPINEQIIKYDLEPWFVTIKHQIYKHFTYLNKRFLGQCEELSRRARDFKRSNPDKITND